MMNTSTTNVDQVDGGAADAMMNTSTTNVDQADGAAGILKTLLAESLASIESDDYEKCLTEVALCGLEIRINAGNASVPDGWYATELARINSTPEGAILNISKHAISNKMKRLKKWAWKAAIQELIVNGIQEKEKNGGGMPKNWYTSSVKKFNESIGTNIGTTTVESLRYHVNKAYLEKSRSHKNDLAFESPSTCLENAVSM
jgi:hypothetical protein